MGVLTTADSQLVFVDTPGLHKPVTALGERVNATALDSVSDVDVVCLVIDATKPFGSGDKWVASHLDMSNAIVIVNKIDAAKQHTVLAQLTALTSLGASEYFPVSAKTGKGIPELVAFLQTKLPEGPQYFPADTVSDQPEEQWVAELVREQLLAVTHDELPYSIATRVTEWEWPRIRVEIIVERDSQKGMVIGKGGLGPQRGRQARPRAAARGLLPRAVREGRQGLAAQARPGRAPGLLMATPAAEIDIDERAGAQRCSLSSARAGGAAGARRGQRVGQHDRPCRRRVDGAPAPPCRSRRADRQRAAVAAGAGAVAAAGRAGAVVRRRARRAATRGRGASAAGCPATPPPRRHRPTSLRRPTCSRRSSTRCTSPLRSTRRRTRSVASRCTRRPRRWTIGRSCWRP